MVPWRDAGLGLISSQASQWRSYLQGDNFHSCCSAYCPTSSRRPCQNSKDGFEPVVNCMFTSSLHLFLIYWFVTLNQLKQALNSVSNYHNSSGLSWNSETGADVWMPAEVTVFQAYVESASVSHVQSNFAVLTWYFSRAKAWWFSETTVASSYLSCYQKLFGQEQLHSVILHFILE